MKVHWTNLAVKHLADLHEHIARTSPQYALRIVDRLTRRSEQIGSFPESGRVVPRKNEPNLREVFEGPYRIVYRIKKGQIDVVAVIHGSRQWPN
jgi:plasmid stabilization system protein ParE